MTWFYILIPCLEALLYIKGPFAVPRGRFLLSDYLYFLLLAAHLAAGLYLVFKLKKKRERLFFVIFRLPELLFLVCLVFFLFSYIYALNANMPYVQRFIESGGAVRLALDTGLERLSSAVKFLPLLILDTFAYIRLRRYFGSGSFLSLWALPLVLVSVVFGVLSFPSFISLEGFPFFAFIALIPLFLVLDSVSYRRGIVYGVSFGLLQGMLLNFWLATFHLIAFQLVSLYLFIFYALFFSAALWLYKRLDRLRFLVFPLAWVLFEYIRSSGFLGYPWGLWGASQYRFIPLIQAASITGVWGIGFIVVLVNSCLARALSLRRPEAWKPTCRCGHGGPRRRPEAWKPTCRCGHGGPRRRPGGKPVLLPLFFGAGVFLIYLGGGLVSLNLRGSLPVKDTVRVALIQQNSDPRKNDYRQTFETLVRLTDQANRTGPDLVVWPETAFVPNIRRWSRLDPEKYQLSRLVKEFLEYQRSLGNWLLTGNDDYELVKGEGGAEVRLDYNAAVFFSPSGRRVETYHKMHLVPFTEYFPWEKSLPGLYRLLLSFDVYLWEPGARRVVFQHPKFSFVTPICFEDAFPGDIRAFIAEGAEAIVNISNDYWSLSEVEAKQHFINSVFRAVENRRPLLRAGASGLTSYVDSEGRLQAEAPYFEETYLVVDLPLRPETVSLYTRFGDWFPVLAGLVLGLTALASLFPRIKARLERDSGT